MTRKKFKKLISTDVRGKGATIFLPHLLYVHITNLQLYKPNDTKLSLRKRMGISPHKSVGM